ncbi:hypothetical protein ACGFOU_33720 [Streptomyces sp. NPDC048595]|uniref:hypothetical protein n=1 Tax=Streptomyces sp. NPDC048595 TaxID=3365576 RepID=UPI003711DCE2
MSNSDAVIGVVDVALVDRLEEATLVWTAASEPERSFVLKSNAYEAPGKPGAVVEDVPVAPSRSAR